jgi:hypothetical protein
MSREEAGEILIQVKSPMENFGKNNYGFLEIIYFI